MGSCVPEELEGTLDAWPEIEERGEGRTVFISTRWAGDGVYEVLGKAVVEHKVPVHRVYRIRVWWSPLAKWSDEVEGE